MADHADRADRRRDRSRPAVAKRALDAMMTMTKIDVAAIEAARQG
jgi:predicted 3-demethylubiquinone-9 3-methyltransferase (glyoxalase superfamily)